MSITGIITIALGFTGVCAVYLLIPEHFYFTMFTDLIATLVIIGTEIKEAIKK